MAPAPHAIRIIIVDPDAKDAESILNSVSENAELYILKDGSDGLEQIGEILGGCSGIDAIEIHVEGRKGKLSLGTRVARCVSTTLRQCPRCGARSKGCGDRARRYGDPGRQGSRHSARWADRGATRRGQGSFKPMRTLYKVRMTLTAGAGPIDHATRGIVRIAAEPRSLAARFWRSSAAVAIGESGF